MTNPHPESDAYTVHKPSPWPLVGGMVVLAGLVATLLFAFGS